MSAASEAAPAPPTRVARVAEAAGRLLGRLDLLTARIRPSMVLVPLAVLGYGVAAWVGSKAVHTGWLYYNSGDGTWYYTTAWMLGHGLIPVTAIGYGYPLVLAPFARIGGPNMLSRAPVRDLLQRPRPRPDRALLHVRPREGARGTAVRLPRLGALGDRAGDRDPILRAQVPPPLRRPPAPGRSSG